MAITTLDRHDRRILDLLQRDASISLNETSGRVRLNLAPLNLGLTVFISIRIGQHTAEWLERFNSAVAAMPDMPAYDVL